MPSANTRETRVNPEVHQTDANVFEVTPDAHPVADCGQGHTDARNDHPCAMPQKPGFMNEKRNWQHRTDPH
jgi:hypothetical protein